MSQDRVHVITTLDLPALHAYRTLRRPAEHIEQGMFVAEGEKVVRRLIASGLPVISFLLTMEWDEILSREEPAYRSRGGEVYVGPKALLSEIVGYRMHQGIMALAKVPPEPDIEAMVARPGPLFVALDDLMNAENVGVVVRNCAGFGVDAILSGETSSSPYLRRAVRNSMGTVFRLPVFHPPDLAAELRRLRERGISMIGTDPHADRPIDRTDLSRGCCLILGSEQSGLRPVVRAECDQFVTIPMKNDTDSLNVAAASAVVLYEAARQRGVGST